MTPFRIFLASPGDVNHERIIAREVIDQVGSERRFRDRLSVQTIAWDRPGAGVPMQAGLTPQEAIAQGLPKPEACDLVVVIVWSRMGTPLPEEYVQADGSRYRSGTEWEYVNGMQGFRTKGIPATWLYHRTEPSTVPFDDPEFDAKRQQWQQVQSFLAALNNPDGSIASGINPYAKPEDFRRLFEQHLRDALERRLEQLGPERPPPDQATNTPQWSQDPYPGLAAFTPEQAPIFFGRGAEVDQLISRLAAGSRFLAVVGVSGSGKSSLVAAGLLPRLRAGVVGGLPWRDCTFSPGERGDNPLLALAYALRSLDTNIRATARDVAGELQVQPDKFVEYVTLDDRAATLVVIDQFEELFTVCGEGYRTPFLTWLDTAVQAPRIRVVVTMRADFFETAVRHPVLEALLQQYPPFPLGIPGAVALQDMVRGPAKAAGLDIDDRLVERVIADAGSAPGALALIAFTLQEVYRLSGASGRLSEADYDAVGGVSGAVRKRTRAALRPLQPAQLKALPDLFNHLVEVNEQEIATRRRAAQAQLHAQPLIDALIDARLLVTGVGDDEQRTVEVAHEAVLRAWPELAQWISEHAEALRARRDLERAASEWHSQGRPGSALKSGVLLKRYRSAADPRSAVARDYLATCGRRVVWQRGAYSLGVIVLLIAGGVLQQAATSDYPMPVALAALAVNLGWPVPRPETVPVGGTPAEPSKYMMGSDTGDNDETPIHEVSFEYRFAVGKYEVTFDEWDLYTAVTGQKPVSDEKWGRGARPVVNVSWDEVQKYLKWLSDQTGEQYRLLSEAEWEYAARAGSQTQYWWGDEIRRGDQAMANCRGCGSAWDGRQTAPVGSFPENPFGLHDLHGNVWEWTQDCWHDTYSNAPADGKAWEAQDGGRCSARVLRGGSWDYVPRFVRSAFRFGFAPDGANYYGVGFRVARTL